MNEDGSTAAIPACVERVMLGLSYMLVLIKKKKRMKSMNRGSIFNEQIAWHLSCRNGNRLADGLNARGFVFNNPNASKPVVAELLSR